MIIDGLFRLFTTALGICLVDCWNRYKRHLKWYHQHKNLKLLNFAKMLMYDLLYNKEETMAVMDRDIFMVIGCVSIEKEEEPLLETIVKHKHNNYTHVSTKHHSK